MEAASIIHDRGFNAASLKPRLQACGYEGDLLRVNYRFGKGEAAPLVGFAHGPADARSACVVAVDVESDPVATVSRCRDLGAPIVFACWRGNVEWWKQGARTPEQREIVPHGQVAGFFQSHRKEFSPDVVYRAKTWGRFDGQYQLKFVDVGLMPLVESEIGKALGDLIAQTVSALKSRLGWDSLTPKKSDWLVKSVFWLLAARILRDKSVPAFVDIDLLDVRDVFGRVAAHYGTSAPIPIGGNRQRDALIEAASTVAQFSNLAVTTTECLAYVYENALISKETRSKLGTHSTPSYLVDYIVGRLAPWIEETPPDQRNIFEPACGHAAFLISAMRLLREMLPRSMSDPKLPQQNLWVNFGSGRSPS